VRHYCMNKFPDCKSPALAALRLEKKIVKRAFVEREDSSEHLTLPAETGGGPSSS
jgi:hypothetical protein